MTGFSLGIVVQNNDPQKRGRVKVFIPHLSLNLYEGWDALTKDGKTSFETDKSFEKLSDPKIKDVIDKIKNQLPWANCAAPIFGENGDHYYNALNTESKTGDGGDKESDKPAKAIEDAPPQDAFENSYQHNSYNNSTKGLFSVPRVGSRVWVFFENNNLNRPVYFATSYDKNDWSNVSDGHYPDKGENFSKNDKLPDDEEYDDSYQNKVVVSQRGGVIEIVNSDNQESVQISHYNGGFKIWSNGGTKEYVEGTERKLISAGSFRTVTNDDNEVILKNQNTTVNENKTTNVIKNVSLTIGENLDINVEKNVTININGSANVTVKEDCVVTSEKNVKIFSGEKIQLNPS